MLKKQNMEWLRFALKFIVSSALIKIISIVFLPKINKIWVDYFINNRVDSYFSFIFIRM